MVMRVVILGRALHTWMRLLAYYMQKTRILKEKRVFETFNKLSNLSAVVIIINSCGYMAKMFSNKGRIL